MISTEFQIDFDEDPSLSQEHRHSTGGRILGDNAAQLLSLAYVRPIEYHSASGERLKVILKVLSFV